MRHFRTQLVDLKSGLAIQSAGGTALVTAAGDCAKATLYNKDGSALANPISLTNGIVEFYTADAVDDVDLFIQSPTGHFVVAKSVVASGPNSIYIDRGQTITAMVIPFSADDFTAASENDTGFDIVGGLLPHPYIDVVTLDDTETMDLGTDSGDSGDADGLLDGASVATAGLVGGSLANGAVTLGALLREQDSANAGDLVSKANFASNGKEITYTPSAGSDTAEGYFVIPCVLPVSSI